MRSIATIASLAIGVALLFQQGYLLYKTANTQPVPADITILLKNTIGGNLTLP